LLYITFSLANSSIFPHFLGHHSGIWSCNHVNPFSFVIQPLQL
jgi:hypothetical protein